MEGSMGRGGLRDRCGGRPLGGWQVLTEADACLRACSWVSTGGSLTLCVPWVNVAGGSPGCGQLCHCPWDLE